MKQMNESDLSIIVYSCWKNREMWNIFSQLFEKYWKDCPYHLILLTDRYNEKEIESDLVFKSIIVFDNTWGNMIKRAIDECNTKYVMLWMDDYLLCDYINTEDILKQLERAKEYHAGNLRLIEEPKCNNLYQNQKYIGIYSYRVRTLSLQIGIWDVGFLNNIIQDNWSAWDFERIGSIDTKNTKWPLLVSLDYTFPYEEGVRRGKWMKSGANLCKRNQIKIDEKKRPIMTNKEMAWIYMKGAIIDINPTFILRIQNFLRRRNKK